MLPERRTTNCPCATGKDASWKTAPLASDAGASAKSESPLLVVDVDVREDRVGTRGDGDACLAEPLQQRALDDDEPPGDVSEPEVGERC